MVCCCTVVLTVIVIIIIYGLKKFFRHGRYTKSTLIDNKIVIITGANTGIGKENAIDLARRGGKVYIACRDKARGEKALEDIRKASGSDRVYFLQLDLASLQSIRDFSDKFHKLEDKLDILINNAGLLSDKRLLTKEGFEIHMGVNHLGHFLLTNLLLDLLKAAAPSRIINVSSLLHKDGKFDKNDLMSEKDFVSSKAYGRSKLANILFTRELARRLQGTLVTANSCHPGLVRTEILRDKTDDFIAVLSKVLMATPFVKTAEEGAQTQIMLAIDPALEDVTGKYFSDCVEASAAPMALDDDLARWLWDKSAELVKLK